MGVGGTKYMTFKLSESTQGTGECTIPFIYARPWEEQPPGWQESPESMVKLKIE